MITNFDSRSALWTVSPYTSVEISTDDGAGYPDGQFRESSTSQEDLILKSRESLAILAEENFEGLDCVQEWHQIRVRVNPSILDENFLVDTIKKSQGSFAYKVFLAEPFLLTQTSRSSEMTLLEEVIQVAVTSHATANFLNELLLSHPKLFEFQDIHNRSVIDWILGSISIDHHRPATAPLVNLWNSLIISQGVVFESFKLVKWVTYISEKKLSPHPLYPLLDTWAEKPLESANLSPKTLRVLMNLQNKTLVSKLSSIYKSQSPSALSLAFKIALTNRVNLETDCSEIELLQATLVKERAWAQFSKPEITFEGNLPDRAPFFTRVFCSDLLDDSNILEFIKLCKSPADDQAWTSFQAAVDGAFYAQICNFVLSSRLNLEMSLENIKSKSRFSIENPPPDYLITAWSSLIEEVGFKPLLESLSPHQITHGIELTLKKHLKLNREDFDPETLPEIIRLKMPSLALFLLEEEDFSQKCCDFLCESYETITPFFNELFVDSKTQNLANKLIRLCPELIQESSLIESPVEFESTSSEDEVFNTGMTLDYAKALCYHTDASDLLKPQLDHSLASQKYTDVFALLNEAASIDDKKLVIEHSLHIALEKKIFCLICHLATRETDLFYTFLNENPSWFSDASSIFDQKQIVSLLKILRTASSDKLDDFFAADPLTSTSLASTFVRLFSQSKWEIVFELVSPTSPRENKSSTKLRKVFLSKKMTSPLRYLFQLSKTHKETKERSEAIQFLKEKAQLLCQCAPTEDIESVIEENPTEFMNLYLDACEKISSKMVRSVYLGLAKKFSQKKSFQKILALFNAKPHLSRNIPHQGWLLITQSFLLKAESEDVDQLKPYIKNYLTTIPQPSEHFSEWKNLLISVYREIYSLESELSSPRKKSIEAFIETMSDKVYFSDKERLGIRLIIPGKDRNALLLHMKTNRISASKLVNREGKSLLSYVCEQEAGPLKKDTIEKLLDIHEVARLAYSVDIHGNTLLQLLIAMNDVESFQVYLQKAPSAVLVSNHQNQSCLQLIASSETHFKEICRKELIEEKAFKTICRSIIEHGIRIGYYDFFQLELLGLSELSPEKQWETLLEQSGLSHLKENQLARLYFCLTSSPLESLTKVYETEPSQIQVWLEEIRSLRPNEKTNIVYDFAIDLLGPFDQKAPCLLTNIALPANPWPFDFSVPEDFLANFEKDLYLFVTYLNDKALDPPLERLLLEHGVSRKENCHVLSRQLIHNIRYKVRIKGLETDEDAFSYYPKLNQVLYLLYEDIKGKPFDEFEANWISIISIANLCALSLEDLKMLAVPCLRKSENQTESSTASAHAAIQISPVSVENEIIQSAYDYRLHIVEMLSGKYVQNNVHAKNGLILHLESGLGIKLDFDDPFALNLHLFDYATLSQPGFYIAAREQYHLHGFVRFWNPLEKLKTKDSMRESFFAKLLENENSSLFQSYLRSKETFRSYFSDQSRSLTEEDLAALENVNLELSDAREIEISDREIEKLAKKSTYYLFYSMLFFQDRFPEERKRLESDLSNVAFEILGPVAC